MLTPQEKRAAERNLKSMTKAVELMCKQCVYMPGGDGPWRQQVQEQCPQPGCPLYNFRPCVGGQARKTGNARRIDSKPRLKLE